MPCLSTPSSVFSQLQLFVAALNPAAARFLNMQKPNPARVLVVIMLVALAFSAGGCASIVHGGNRLLTISSDPSAAKATISKTGGEIVSVTNTPCTVSLDPKRGYFKGQSYNLKLELPGYQTAQVELRAEMSGWYWGNIVFGGLIGMIVVDPLT
jgi:hypothetical protein